ncbi:dentin sialophosphoprotein-like isoform X1 [Poecilia formosa]|uniref:dentin sialophosphoprotein-like isoform X1 n=1 Tax=Poecilia formosa TaxID=48698 RepID=UPI000443E930|nr:PREDICTED: dentin sialophosphoprotein-like isoform X1 [Poecilia formosa]
MKLIIITCCLIGAAFANPILHNILVSTESESNSTESLSVLESSENNTSELQSSEENTSNQSSESESVESTSEDKTSEESDSQSDESDGMDSMAETKDNSMGSEENVRKQSWVRVFPSIIEGASGEDNTSTEVTGHPGLLDNELSGKRPTHTMKVQIRTKQPLLGQSTDGSDTTSDSADASDSSDVSAAASDSTDSSSSSESQESQETSDSNDSSTASKSTEDSNASDSAELEQVRAKNCVNSTQSCESEEYFLQSIGDDAHSPGEHLLVPDEDERELRLRR